MGLDIRLPLGLMFLSTGGILFIYGLFTRGSAMYVKSGGMNLNLIWGGLMLLFGAAMYFAGRRAKWQDNVGTPRPWEQSSATDTTRHGH